MGKQICYWMDHDSFVLLAQKALEKGCTIVKEDPVSGKVLESRDIRLVTDEKTPVFPGYFFHLPEAGPIAVKTVRGEERLERGYTSSGAAVIEAGYSHILSEPASSLRGGGKKVLHRARLFCISGYYSEQSEYIPRPDCLTRVYHALARYVKKLAPCTEFTETRISIRAETCGQEIEYRHREYITPACLEMVRREGYRMSI